MTDYNLNVIVNNTIYDKWKDTLSAAGYRVFGAGSQLREINRRIVEASMSEAIKNPGIIKSIMGEVE